MSGEQNPKSMARQYCLQFLYQCEIEKLFYFSESHFETFVKNFEISSSTAKLVHELSKGTFDHLERIDEHITASSQNWSLSRMLSTDRIVLRMATFELISAPDVPTKVVLNEAIELAKRYGSEESGVFVNGILDHVAKEVRTVKP